MTDMPEGIMAPDLQAHAEIEALVEAWFNQHFVGSRANTPTELWNAAQAAKEDLKRRLAAHFGENK